MRRNTRNMALATVCAILASAPVFGDAVSPSDAASVRRGPGPAESGRVDARSLAASTLESSGEAASASAAVREAEARLAAARRAKFPVVGMDARASWIGNPSDAVVVSAGELGSIPSAAGLILLPGEDLTIYEAQEPLYYQVAFTVDQPLWTWGKLDAAASFRGAELSLAEARSAKAATESLASLYSKLYALRYQREALSLARVQVGLSALTVSAAKSSLDAGALTALEYRAAELEAEGLARTLARLEEGERALGREIESLAGLPRGASSEEGFGSGLRAAPAIPDLPLERWLRSAEAYGYDAAVAERAARTAERAALLSSLEAAGRPDVGLSLRGGWNGSRLPIQDGWEEKGDWFVGATVAVKGQLFDSGRGAADSRAAGAAADRARHEADAAAERLALAVASAYDTLSSLEADLRVSERRLGLERDAVEDAAARLDAGAIGEAELLRARSRLLAAQLEDVKLRTEYAGVCVGFLSLASPYEILSGAAFLESEGN